MASVSQHFCVPLVYDDLTDNQSLEQAINALSILEETSNQIFSKIEERVLKESARLNEITSRINIANDKVLSIAKDRKKKATYVHSSAKYPIESGNTYKYIYFFK